MAFPPNYGQERNNRSRSKAQKTLDKQLEREEKSRQRKAQKAPDNDRPAATPGNPDKEQK